MPYPNSIDSYTTKINKNASGWYVPTDYVVIPAAAPYESYLDHVPRDIATTVIADYTYTAGVPGVGQYNLDLIYGKVTFSAGNTPTTKNAKYYCLGDDIMAEHMNEVQNDIIDIENTLGTLPAGSSVTVRQRLETIEATAAADAIASGINGQRITDGTIRPGAVVSNTGWAGKMGAVSPGLTYISTVQDHIDRGGVATKTFSNPHGTSITELTSWDSDVTLGVTTLKDLYVDNIIASGSYISLLSRGPNQTQSIFFYDQSTPLRQYFRWYNPSSEFQLSEDLLINGNVTVIDAVLKGVSASGNLMPAASGYVAGPNNNQHSCVGTIAVPFASGNFDVLQASSYKTGASSGATGGFTTADGKTVTVRNGLVVSIV